MNGSGNTTLLEFKAGICSAAPQGDGKFRIEADERKGRISLVSGTDGAIHLYFKLRPSGEVVEDILVFPNNQTFSKVDTGRSGDRVYLLQFKRSTRRFFFWMQGSNSADDETNCRKLNEYMDNPFPGLFGAGGAGGAGGGDGSQGDLMRILQGFGGDGSGGGNELSQDDLNAALSRLSQMGTFVSLFSFIDCTKVMF